MKDLLLAHRHISIYPYYKNGTITAKNRAHCAACN